MSVANASVTSERARRDRIEPLAAVGELAADAAHEINNPLASIKGFAQLLSRETVDRGQLQALEIISQECSRIAKVVDNLLNFATQQRTVGRERVDLEAVARETLALKRYSLETSGVAIELDLESELSAVEADTGALQRLMLILLAQAERSLAGRETGRRLTIRTRETNEGVAIHVIDNGTGIDRALLPEFLNGAADPTLGLGPSAAKRIIEEHGGDIWVESPDGLGTTFIFRLPRAENISEQVATPAREPLESAVAAPGPVRVLIADDEPMLRLALSIFLRRHGYEVEEAEDADGAFDLAISGRFDVALVDVKMPGDGLRLIERLNATENWTGSAILMTGEHVQNGGAGGVWQNGPYLTKPFDMMDAVRLIDSVSGGTIGRRPGNGTEWTSS